VNELVSRFDQDLKAKVPPLMEKLRLYFASSIEKQRVFKPFKFRLLELTARLKQILNREYTAAEISPTSSAALDATNITRYLDGCLLASNS
jgi:hypothetical protein